MLKILAVIATLSIVVILFGQFYNPKKPNPPSPSPSPTQTPFGFYVVPKVNPAEAYTIFLVGDSMTAALGPNIDKLGVYLGEMYPNKIFGIFNYSLPSTNILSVSKRFNESTDITERVLPPILESDFEVIIIESFGHNPLSHLSLQEGLKKQDEELEKIVKTLIKARPNTVIVFLATISPNTEKYAKSVDLSPEIRKEWAEERVSYIKNHIKFAQNHKIPLINVFDKSLDASGDGNLVYIASHDYIHPSEAGVELISKEIADYLYQTLPK